MIHDALDGGNGRHVYAITMPGFDPLYVIAATEQAAREWFAAQLAPLPTPHYEIADRGSADRTEIAVWKDVTRL